LKSVLTYHVVSGSVPASQVVKLSSAKTVEGEPLAIAVTNGGVMLNGTSNVVRTDVMASNGIIHVIDSVLLPPSMSQAMAASSTVAQDGQSLASQSAATQALFKATWGPNAATQWVTEHNGALAH